MTNYRHQLPQLSDRVFITDAGLETVLLFQQGWDLPDFASFTLLDRPLGTAALRNYFDAYGELAQTYGMGLVLEGPTWRAHADWGKRQGYGAAELADVNRRAIALLELTRNTYDTPNSPIVLSGCIGPRGDGYNPGNLMSATEAEQYHQDQIDTFRDTTADLITAMTITYAAEAIGIRANASMMSHAELDEAETLDDGNPQDLGERFYTLKQQLPHLSILGGCCGTDHRHIEAICKACGPVVSPVMAE